MITCEQIMTKNPTCCLATDTVDRVAQLMKAEDVGAVPVINSPQGQKLLGILTDRDLAVKVVAEERVPQATRVAEVMSANPVTCRNTDNVQQAVSAMALAQVRRVPIVDETNRVVGIIAQADIATRLADPTQTAVVVEEISKP